MAATYSLLEPSASLSSSLQLVVAVTYPFLLPLAPFLAPLSMPLGGVVDLWELMALPGEVSDVIPEGFTWLLIVTLQVLGIAGLHIRALYVTCEDALEILPTIDHVFW
jgi:hypothetical protein